jgi:hypothetical protein
MTLAKRAQWKPSLGAGLSVAKKGCLSEAAVSSKSTGGVWGSRHQQQDMRRRRGSKVKDEMEDNIQPYDDKSHLLRKVKKQKNATSSTVFFELLICEKKQ